MWVWVWVSFPLFLLCECVWVCVWVWVWGEMLRTRNAEIVLPPADLSPKLPPVSVGVNAWVCILLACEIQFTPLPPVGGWVWVRR